MTNTGYEMFSCECLWDVRVSGRAAFVMHTSNCVNFQCDIIFITSLRSSISVLCTFFLKIYEKLILILLTKFNSFICSYV